MKIVYNRDALENFTRLAIEASPEHPVLIDKFLEDAVEVDVDAICDGQRTIIGGIMEHVEEAGIHSGDSACILPPQSIAAPVLTEIADATRAMAQELNVVGLMNVQYAIKGDQVFVLEVNPGLPARYPLSAKRPGYPWRNWPPRSCWENHWKHWD